MKQGLCECGCSGKTVVAKQTDRRSGYIKGESKRFIHGHHIKGVNNPLWKGGRSNSSGYVVLLRQDHPRANSNGYVYEHILVAEKALDKFLPKGTVVHHVNGIKTDNRPSNLVICPDQAYHLLLHQRQRALKACGDSSARKCRRCKEYDTDLSQAPDGRSYHRTPCSPRLKN